ncbi:MAG: YggS family pyridoxal phosphate-dependent enzyme [Acidimicrobiales bacterium]
MAERVAAVRERIARAGGDPAQVQLVAVTKGFGVDVVRAALAAEVVDLGENYAQDLLAKVADLDPATDPTPRWHFVGRLQRNKVRKVAPSVGLWQSVDRLSLGTEIARWAPGAPVLVQVDLTGEPTKGGCPPSDVPQLLDGLAALGLDVRGLMGIGPLADPEAARPGFRELSQLANKYGLFERSMGMSADLEVAVQEGATMIRVGSGLFGPRPGSIGVRH